MSLNVNLKKFANNLGKKEDKETREVSGHVGSVRGLRYSQI
jgi:hypothetical protein